MQFIIISMATSDFWAQDVILCDLCDKDHKTVVKPVDVKHA